MFSKVELAKRAEFLDKAKVAREERANERQRDLSAIKIQVCYWSILFLMHLFKFSLQIFICLLYTSDAADE